MSEPTEQPPAPQPPERPLASSSARTGRLIALGGGQALRSTGPVLVLFALRTVDVLARGAFFTALAAGLAFETLRWMGAATVAFVLLSAGLQIFALGGAIRQVSNVLSGRKRSAWLAACVDASPRSGAYLIVAAALELGVTLYRWVVVGTGGFFYGRALLERHGGFLGSVAFALALTIALPLGFAAMLWAEASLARAVSRDEPVTVAFAESFAALLARPGPAVAVGLLTGFLAATGTVALRVVFSAFRFSSSEWVGSAAGTCAAVLGAMVLALLELWRVATFTAFDLDRQGRLVPEQRRSPMVPVGPVIEARPLSP